MHHVIIIGSRGYIKKYGGWETLIHGMIDNWIDQNTKFYVIEVSTEPNEPEFEKIDKIECIRVRTRLKGSLQMLEANAKAIQQLPKYIKKFHMLNPILYVLGPRVGFFFFLKLPMLKRNRVAVVKNTDGIEWKRDKYGFFRRLYILIDGFFFDRFVMDYLVADAKEMLRIYKDKLDSRKKPCDMRVIYYGTNKTNSLNGPIPDNVKSFFERYSIKLLFDN
jgi:rhamnosyltransferase